MFTRILITGASSGIGEALALAYAGAGVRLVLTGRDAARLAAVEQACGARGAQVTAAAIDVADRAAMAALLAQADDDSPFDLVIANAGISAGTGSGEESAAQLDALTDVNVLGVINTLAPLLERLSARRRGQIGLMSSLAGFHGVAGAPGYGASKAWVRVYGEGLRGALAPHGVGVSVICPGFVRSRMTAPNRFPMPFLMDAERAAAIIRRGLAANRPRIAFPWPMVAAVWLMMALPSRVTAALVRRLPRKD
jgi:short-subunit dehydrogenase